MLDLSNPDLNWVFWPKGWGCRWRATTLEEFNTALAASLKHQALV